MHNKNNALLFRYQKDTQVGAQVQIVYHEFDSEHAVATQMRHYRVTPSAIENPRKYEPYKYGVTIASGPYLVNGTRPSTSNRVVECHFYKEALQEYRTRQNTGGQKNNKRLHETDVMALSELGARLGIDQMLTHFFKDQKFDIVSSDERHPVDIDPDTEETNELVMRFLLRTDKSFDAAVDKRPAHSVTLAAHLTLPLDTLGGDFIEGKHHEAGSVNFARHCKLLRLSSGLSIRSGSRSPT